MMRVLHRWGGVLATLLLILVSSTGVVLSVFPALRAGGGGAPTDLGTLVAGAEAALPGLNQIQRMPGGQVIASAFGPNGFQQVLLDPSNGGVLQPYSQSPVEIWFQNLHRALFLEDPGRLIVLGASVAMMLLLVSGYWVTARRMGGWRKMFSRVHAKGAGAWHLSIARIAGIGLILSTVTGLSLGAATFGLIPQSDPMPQMPANVTQGPEIAPAAIPALQKTSVKDLVQMSLPRQGDPNGLYRIETQAGAGYIDPVSGKVENWVPRSLLSKIMQWVHLIHTGQGAAWLGLLLGLASLSVPVLSGTGVIVWLKGRKRGRSRDTVAAEEAQIVLLTGSEGGTTWRFSRATAQALQEAGKSVHLGKMSEFDPDRYGMAEAIVLFAASSGEGDAPEGAIGFLDRFAARSRAGQPPIAILGFGDRSYPNFCGYAEKVARLAKAKGWQQIVPLGHVDRQSESDADHWITAFGGALGLELHVTLAPVPTKTLQLVSRRDFGQQVQAPTSILRFALPRRSLLDRILRRGFSGFHAGDLLQIRPMDGGKPRSYSLASSARDGFVEICVRTQPGGRVSPWLTSLEPGETVEASLVENPRFRAPRDERPLILIGAGAGVGALAGFVRANQRGREAHLYMGFRALPSQMPYHEDLAAWQQDGRLTRVVTASSRTGAGRYVQHLLADDAEHIAQLVAQGARVMVCGGREMAQGVGHVLSEALRPLGLDPHDLREEGRYVEDVF